MSSHTLFFSFYHLKSVNMKVNKSVFYVTIVISVMSCKELQGFPSDPPANERKGLGSGSIYFTLDQIFHGDLIFFFISYYMHLYLQSPYNSTKLFLLEHLGTTS